MPRPHLVPAAGSPVQISRDTTVADRFSGYEWRMVLERGTTSWLVAFVIPPDARALTLHRFLSNEEAADSGGAAVHLAVRRAGEGLWSASHALGPIPD